MTDTELRAAIEGGSVLTETSTRETRDHRFESSYVLTDIGEIPAEQVRRALKWVKLNRSAVMFSDGAKGFAMQVYEWTGPMT